ncbi:MAG: hypothetical protein EA420_08880 [Candidatus Competibacteraceae bacterium]|nr:MAG: hypothetical protein EA420_08880 [Candidatus Competibacteraceae bacterium]
MNERNQSHVLPRRSRRVLSAVSSLVLSVALALAAAVPREAGARGEQVGTASWYGPGFHGKKTASGKRFNQHARAAAQRLEMDGTARVRIKAMP